MKNLILALFFILSILSCDKSNVGSETQRYLAMQQDNRYISARNEFRKIQIKYNPLAEILSKMRLDSVLGKQDEIFVKAKAYQQNLILDLNNSLKAINKIRIEYGQMPLDIEDALF